MDYYVTMIGTDEFNLLKIKYNMCISRVTIVLSKVLESSVQKCKLDFLGFFKGGGGGGSHCVTPNLLTRLSCRHPRCVLLKVTFFRMSSERVGRDKPTK